MYGPIFWWWTVFIVILLSGVMGGFARYQWDKTLPGSNDGRCFSYIVIGVAAAFLVPLFLNTISSTLVKDTETEPSKFFILIGFCIAASVYAKKFIGSVADKALDKALKDSDKAVKVAKEASEDARSADNRAIALYRPLKLIDNGNYQDACLELEEIITFDSDNSEAWAWKAYCLKRLARFEEAISAIETALRLEGKENFKWLYNLACYKCLVQKEAADVVQVLAQIRAKATPEQTVLLRRYLNEDADFARIRNDQAFLAFMNGFN
jgi:tetratricopeptide (TPR) repeat protein